MKRGISILILALLLILPLISAEDQNTSTEKPTTTAWDKTITISKTWQTLIGTFFGLNIKNVSTEISVKETLTLIMIFIMFLVIIHDILKMTPFFKSEKFPSELLAALIITTLVSLTGAFLTLKDLFINLTYNAITSLKLDWLTSAYKNPTWSSIIIGILVIFFIFLIKQLLEWGNTIIKRYSRISRMEAAGRKINETIKTQS